MQNAIDDYDRQILSLLQNNGRLTNQELGKLIGLSTSQCSRRRIALEQQGYIEGYQARLAPKAQLLQIQGLVEITLNNHHIDIVTDFHHQVAKNPMILDAYKITGEYDYQLKIAAANLAQMNELINELSSYRGVSQIKTSVILENIKENRIVRDFSDENTN
ncbi:Lrp/AsnC family transcriptional regulator [Celerinatantimonas sp. YJH-8]|uniref:Lrp/AsnC family transcriptional regulator n=1 Tax=Celerinatantimonas sp. YJH-8 TaxID=3228714 RepID=UPI0038C80AA0